MRTPYAYDPGPYAHVRPHPLGGDRWQWRATWWDLDQQRVETISGSAGDRTSAETAAVTAVAALRFGWQPVTL